jgi:hypothetical protein
MYACYATVSVASYGLEVDAEAVATKRQKIVANDAGLDESDLRTALNHFDCIDAQRACTGWRRTDASPPGTTLSWSRNQG